ncbi:hypothetical protein V1264_013914 [Littorina saxatilis]
MALPNFQDLARFYPGYWHHGGRYHNHHLLAMIGTQPQDASLLLHDTSALRLSYALNRIGGRHSLGRQLIRLSKFGHDSISGADGLEYMFHPIAYGPFLADKYGYPSVSKLHEQDPVSTKKNFWGRQGILRVITYTKVKNMPKGHVALWDCNHFHESKDWIAGHSLITVEFWESPDSNCSTMDSEPRYLHHTADQSGGSSPGHTSRGAHRTSSSSSSSSLPLVVEASRPHPKLRHKHWERQFIAKHHLAHDGRDGHSGTEGRENHAQRFPS